MTEQENAIKIAVIDEQIKGLREQQKSHHEDTKCDIAAMTKKLDELTAIMNRGKGAYAASMAIAGAVGALAITIVSSVLDFFHR